MFGAMMGFLWLGVGPLVAGAVAEMFGLQWQAMIQGLAFMSHQLGSFLGAYGGGLIYDQLGSYTLAWRIGVAVGLAAGIIQVAFALVRPTRAASGAGQLNSHCRSRELSSVKRRFFWQPDMTAASRGRNRSGPRAGCSSSPDRRGLGRRGPQSRRCPPARFPCTIHTRSEILNMDYLHKVLCRLVRCPRVRIDLKENRVASRQLNHQCQI